MAVQSKSGQQPSPGADRERHTPSCSRLRQRWRNARRAATYLWSGCRDWAGLECWSLKVPQPVGEDRLICRLMRRRFGRRGCGTRCCRLPRLDRDPAPPRARLLASASVAGRSDEVNGKASDNYGLGKCAACAGRQAAGGPMKGCECDSGLAWPAWPGMAADGGPMAGRLGGPVPPVRPVPGPSPRRRTDVGVARVALRP